MAKKSTSTTSSSKAQRNDEDVPAEISAITVSGLLTPLLGTKGAELSVTIDLPANGAELAAVQEFARLSGARARVDLTIDLGAKTDHKDEFTQLVLDFLEHHNEESLKITVCASCGFQSTTPSPVTPPVPVASPTVTDDDQSTAVKRKRKKR